MKIVNKVFLTLACVGVVAAGFLFWRTISPGDAWVQDKVTGAWMRRGDPVGAPPRRAIEDCFEKGRTLSYDTALQACIGRLCTNDAVCINGVLDGFNIIRNAQAQAGEEPSQAEQAAAPLQEQDTDDPAFPMPPEEAGASAEDAASLPPDTPAPSPEESDQSTQGADDASHTSPAILTETSLLKLHAPTLHASLQSPFTITGDAHESVTALTVRVKGEQGQTLIEETVTPRAEAHGGWRSFKLTLAYEFSRTKSGTVEITPAAPSGDQSPVAVPVDFQ